MYGTGDALYLRKDLNKVQARKATTPFYTSNTVNFISPQKNLNCFDGTHLYTVAYVSSPASKLHIVKIGNGGSLVTQRNIQSDFAVSSPSGMFYNENAEEIIITANSDSQMGGYGVRILNKDLSNKRLYTFPPTESFMPIRLEGKFEGTLYFLTYTTNKVYELDTLTGEFTLRINNLASLSTSGPMHPSIITLLDGRKYIVMSVGGSSGSGVLVDLLNATKVWEKVLFYDIRNDDYFPSYSPKHNRIYLFYENNSGQYPPRITTCSPETAGNVVDTIYTCSSRQSYGMGAILYDYINEGMVVTFGPNIHYNSVAVPSGLHFFDTVLPPTNGDTQICVHQS